MDEYVFPPDAEPAAIEPITRVVTTVPKSDDIDTILNILLGEEE